MAKLSVERTLVKAKSHMKKGELAEAQTLYAAILKAFPNNKKAQQAQAILGKTRQRGANQGPPPEIRNQLVKLYEQGQFLPIVEQAQVLTKLYPEALLIWFVLGVANKELGRDEEASIAFKKVTELDPKNFEGHNNLGTSHAELGRLDEAIGSYDKALSIKPDYVEAYSNMGNALQAQGKIKEATMCFEKALSIKPDHAKTMNNFAILLYESRLYQKAAKLFSRDDTIKGQSNLLKCFYEQGEEEKFSTQIDYLLQRGANNAVIGSFLSRSEASFGIKKNNPFCKKPLDYVSQVDLKKECDFNTIFVENAFGVLNDDIVKQKKQSHLTNGIQTAGNLFTQVGSVTDQWQNIIRTELTKYKEHFCESEEGFIRDWPSDYSIYGWLVSMKSGGKLAAHIHDTGWMTGSIYINVPPKFKKDSGNLVVTIDDEKHTKARVENRKSIDVVTGSLCLFPSSLLHYTMPFESDEDRIVLAFDVVPK